MSSAFDFDPKPRRASVAVDVGGVIVGGGAPVVVQSMTNTDTADVDATVAQVAALYRAGSELVRITVDRDESAAAVPKIRERLLRLGMDVPLIGDFHYIGHKLLADHPACAEALAKYRINPGNVGFKDKKDKQFAEIIEMAIRYDKPVRIGVNWGSLDQELLTRADGRERRPRALRCRRREVTRETIVQSALISADLAEEIGLPRNRIILSAKVSQRAGPDRRLFDAVGALRPCAASRAYRGRHGLARASSPRPPPWAILLQQGIGDTIRVSLTPEPERRPHPRGAGGAGTAAGHGFPPVRPGRRRLSRLRPHDLDGVPGAGPEDRGRHPQATCRSGARNIRASKA